MSKARPITVPAVAACPSQPETLSTRAIPTLNPVDKVAHAPLSNGKPWPPSPPTAIKQAIKADERRKSLLGDTVLTWDSGRDADDELSEEWTEDEAFFAGPMVYRQTSVKKRISSEENRENVAAFVEKAVTSAPLNPVADFGSDVDVPLAPFDGTLAASVASYPANDRHESTSQPFLDAAPAYDIPRVNQAPIEQRQPAPSHKALSPISTPITSTDMHAYNKRIAEPMSEWVAEYIWKVVTHGMSLPPEFVANESGYGCVYTLFILCLTSRLLLIVGSI